MDRGVQEEGPAASAGDSNGTSMVHVTKDGLVTKQVLRPGQGEIPPLHARCLGEAVSVLTNPHRHQHGPA